MRPIYIAGAAVLTIALVVAVYLSGILVDTCTVATHTIQIEVSECDDSSAAFVLAIPVDPAAEADNALPVSLLAETGGYRDGIALVPQLPDGWTDYLVTEAQIVCQDASSTAVFEFGRINSEQPESKGDGRGTKRLPLEDVKVRGQGCGEQAILVRAAEGLVIGVHNARAVYLTIINRTKPEIVERTAPDG